MSGFSDNKFVFSTAPSTVYTVEFQTDQLVTGLSGSLVNVPAITITGISQVSVSSEFDLTSSTLPFSFISSGPRMEIKTND